MEILISRLEIRLIATVVLRGLLRPLSNIVIPVIECLGLGDR